MEEIEAIIFGRVQMVMYRDFAQRNARRLKLTGFVKNNPDGTVTVVAQGEKGTLEKLIIVLKKGSLLSNVENTKVEWKNSTKIYSDFTIEY